MNGIGYAGVLDEAFQVLLSSLIVYALYGTFHTRYALFPLAIPLIIDSDHFLSAYSEGIKVFHSAAFISLLALPFIAYGLLKMDRRVMYMGAVAYVISVFNLSFDLLEGGGISFLYPFSDTRYVLQTSISTNMTVSLIMVVGFSLMAAYVLRIYLDLDRTGFTGEPHIGHS